MPNVTQFSAADLQDFIEEKHMITLADARRVIAAAQKKTEQIGQPSNVAAVDSGVQPCRPHAHG